MGRGREFPKHRLGVGIENRYGCKQRIPKT